jgi:hypothetical protein
MGRRRAGKKCSLHLVKWQEAGGGGGGGGCGCGCGCDVGFGGGVMAASSCLEGSTLKFQLRRINTFALQTSHRIVSLNVLLNSLFDYTILLTELTI